MSDLFLLVLAGHLLGDFVAQTDWQAGNKVTSWRADCECTDQFVTSKARVPA